MLHSSSWFFQVASRNPKEKDHSPFRKSSDSHAAALSELGDNSGSAAFSLSQISLASASPLVQPTPFRADDDTYSCPYPGCGMTGMSLYKFHRHKRLHTGERFACDVCGQQFLDKGVLKRHQDVHTGGFKCGWCTRVFRSKTGLYMHMRTLHAESLPEGETGEPPSSPQEPGNWSAWSTRTWKLIRLIHLPNPKACCCV